MPWVKQLSKTEMRTGLGCGKRRYLGSFGSGWVRLKLRQVLSDYATHQTDENAYQLNDVGVSHGIETPEERVENGDAGREDDCYCLV